jgi:ribonucleoside-diphosphate reductase alpha chain
MPVTPTEQLAHEIWESKYKHSSDQCRDDTFRRVANALVPENPEPYFSMMRDGFFCPGGRILAGAGTGRKVTLFNCYVMGTIEDSLPGILKAQQEAALTMQQGGGVGMDFSTLRPKGAPVKGLDAEASGPISFMHIWDATCRTIMSAGTRRGAMMGVLRVDHPDIGEFIEAKRDPHALRMFNVSVGVTDLFMDAILNDGPFNLEFGGKVYKTIRARDLWEKLMRSTYECAEPGVLFLDTINGSNHLRDEEYLATTNPCGEVPLPPYGACLLGAINLAKFVFNPFSSEARVGFGLLDYVAERAVELLDRVVDVSEYPLPQQEELVKKQRRMGLGITGLADMLVMLGYRYSSEQARDVAEEVMKAIKKSAERISNGRNSHLLTIAPTGTTSLFLGNVSSGLEPIFATEYTRKVLEADGSKREVVIEDYAVSQYHMMFPGEPLPDHFETVADLKPEHHLKMQAALQKHIDNSISKTINVPEDFPFEDFKDIYMEAWLSGCKGCTTYRPNSITGSILSVAEPVAKTPTPVLIDRPAKLEGATYKLNWAGKPSAYYVTINDKDGQPYEVFVATKDPADSAWLAAITRLISAVYRRGGAVDFVAHELQEIYDATGGMWANGVYIPSFLALLGSTIAKHSGAKTSTGAKCPTCGEMAFTKEAGCDVCKSCGYSKCG